MAEEKTVIRIVASLLVAAAVLMPGRPAPAKEVKINHGGLTLNADLELAGGKTLADGVVLMTHSLLAYKGMEIMTALKGLLAEGGLNTLAINLSLDLDDRHGMVDCPTPHRHRDADDTTTAGRRVWNHAEAWIKVRHKLVKSLAEFVRETEARPYTMSDGEDSYGGEYDGRYKRTWKNLKAIDKAIKAIVLPLPSPGN